MRFLAVITVFLSLAAAGQIIHIPLGSKATNQPYWATSPGTNQVVGWQAWQAVETNFVALTNVWAGHSVTNATNTTWGYGGGLLRWDTNYLYVSIGTNAWKRVAITNW